MKQRGTEPRITRGWTTYKKMSTKIIYGACGCLWYAHENNHNQHQRTSLVSGQVTDKCSSYRVGFVRSKKPHTQTLECNVGTIIIGLLLFLASNHK